MSFGRRVGTKFKLDFGVPIINAERMDTFVARLNIAHFQKCLASEPDPAKRALLERLLIDEEAKLAAVEIVEQVTAR